MNTYLYNAKHTLPDKFKEFSPYNGWGTYEGLCEFVLEYILTIYKYPDAIIKACR